MASFGDKVRDLLPIPDSLEMVTNPEKEDISHSLAQEPTASHALAMADHDEKGRAQEAHDGEVKDLGWRKANDKIASPLVGGIENEELWVLIRRFNKQTYDVKEVSRPVPGSLDLNIADEEEFSPDKLRASLERLYMTIAIGLLSALKHIARIRSWRETRRTAVFCAAYTVAWLFDFIVPLLSATMIALVVYPPSRNILFPPAPIALVSTKSGGVQKPKAGVLGSTDSATGAPENYKGEAVEAEANNFVNSIASVAISSASGKHPQSEPTVGGQEVGAPGASAPDPTAVVTGAANARVSAGGGTVSTTHDKTKVPMETAMWNQMRPIMHGLSDACDTWERFQNALSPTPPFSRDLYRLRLAAVVVPLLGASIFITSYMVTKSMMFGIGFGFFGDPVIQPGLNWLNTNFPNWQKLLELRNTLLKGVPTNAQLTITLLRVGEANKAPLLPPPRSDEPPPNEAVDVDKHLEATGGDIPLNANEEDIKAAIEHDPNTPQESAGADIDASKQKKHGGKAAHLLSAFKTSVKGSVETTLGADHLKAKVGSKTSKHRLGVISRRSHPPSGPVVFKCRGQGKKGAAYISTRATIPCISFAIDKSTTGEDQSEEELQTLKPVWTVAIADIREIKKIGGLGWKAKLVVGWALDREIADSMMIEDRQGNQYTLTAMLLRDELFNRLVAMGGQKWEAW